MNDEMRFQNAWEEYRRLRNRQYIVGVVALIMPSLIFFALHKGGMESNKAVVVLSFLSIFAAIVMLAVIFHFHKWNCPNCAKRFFVRSFRVRFPEQLSNCSNCNLPKYAHSAFKRN